MSQQKQIDAIVAGFRGLPRGAQSSVLTQLLQLCELPQLRRLLTEISPLLAVDFVKFMPWDVCVRILACLDVHDLVQCAFTCKLWRGKILHGDGSLWVGLCGRYGYARGRSIHPGMSVIAGAGITSGTSALDWMDVFRRCYSVQSHWRTGRYTILPTLRGHKQPISALLIDDTVAVSGSLDNTVRVWDLVTGKLLLTFDDATSHVTCLAMHASTLVSGAEDGLLRKYNIKIGRLERTMSGHTAGISALTCNHSIAVSTSIDRTVRVWDLKTGVYTHALSGHSDEIPCIAMCGDVVFTGSWDNTVRSWDVVRGKPLYTMRGHTEGIFCLKSNSSTVVSGSADGSVRLWSHLSGDCLQVMQGHAAEVYCVDMTEEHIVSGSADTTVRVWNMAGKCMHVLTEHVGIVRAVKMDAYKLVSGGDNRQLIVWDYRHGHVLHQVYRHPCLLVHLQCDAMRIVTASPETPGTLCIINYF